MTRATNVLGLVLLFFITALMAPFLFAHAATDTLFEDGFESGDFSKWSLTSNLDWFTVDYTASAHSGDYRAEARGRINALAVNAKYLSTEGYENVSLSFWYNVYKTLEEGESFVVDYYDGSSWQNLMTIDENTPATDWQEWSGTLPAAAYDNPDFALRMGIIAGSATSDIVRIDDVLITGETLSDPDSDADGVLDVVDLCFDTVADDFTDWGRSNGRYRWDGFEWLATEKGAKGFMPDMEYTYGCSGTQILDGFYEATGEYFAGHYKHGLTKSVLQAWHDQAF